MAIDLHALNLMRLAASSGQFRRTALIGRQGLSVSKATIRKIFNDPHAHNLGPFCEELLKICLGSTIVDSYDYSDFEGATHIVDLNEPLVNPPTYDTVIDCGSLEHIYDVPQALENISLLCAEGGKILHVLPANNYCGHGFWQFSPELFFSLYSSGNGYEGTRVFLAGAPTAFWYEVQPPRNGIRVDITSSTKVLVLVITTLVSSFRHKDIQQSDYLHVWRGAQVMQQRRLSQLLLGPPESERRSRLVGAFNKLSLLPLARVLYDVLSAQTTLSGRNPRLIKRNICELLTGQTKSLVSMPDL